MTEEQIEKLAEIIFQKLLTRQSEFDKQFIEQLKESKGDFEIEVLLNEDRTLSLKFFNRENSIQNFGEQIGYTQGLGLSYNVEFNNLNELFKRLFEKKTTPTLTSNKSTSNEDESSLSEYNRIKNNKL